MNTSELEATDGAAIAPAPTPAPAAPVRERKAAGATPPVADATPSSPEQPSAGGSYHRQPDGSLQRVEFTEHAAPSNDGEEEV